jgi:hypothetical protein
MLCQDTRAFLIQILNRHDGPNTVIASASEAIHQATEKVWIAFVAEPVIGRAFARPVGSLAQTLRVCRRQ